MSLQVGKTGQGGRSRVAVVGAGAIGSRHVQAMARVAASIDLDIVDPVPEARHRAMVLLNETGGLRDGSVRVFDRIGDIDSAPDIVVIATSSRDRPQAIRELIALGARAMILEKVLFTRLADHDAIDHAIAEGGVRAWVNCPRNAFPRAERLSELIGDEPFHYRVEGQSWGLACNLIHHLHEFSSLARQYDVRLDPAALDPVVSPSKRSNYVEFFGRVSGEAAGGMTFAAVCEEGSVSARTITIDCGDRRLTISPQQMLTIEHGGRTATEPYPMTLQSEMTAGYIEAILKGQSPRLPDYSSASRLHRIMLGAFLDHLRRVHSDDSIDECPVT